MIFFSSFFIRSELELLWIHTSFEKVLFFANEKDIEVSSSGPPVPAL